MANKSFKIALHNGTLKSRSIKAASMLISALVCFMVSLLACSGKEKSNNRSAMREAVPVLMAQVVQQRMTSVISSIGTVEAYATVEVKSQVTGQLRKVAFREGQEVKKGDILFVIDERSFELLLKQSEAELEKDQSALKQAEANLAKAIAQANYVESQAKRSRELIESKVISEDAYESAKSGADSARAEVRANEAAVQDAKNSIKVAQAAVENAKLELSYCIIRSPLDGQTGKLMVDEGNLVKANDTTALLAINQTSPIYVDFSVPEKFLGEIQNLFSRQRVTVEAIIPDKEPNPIMGELSLIDNRIDKNTGTIPLRAVFANKDKRLWPGQFVKVNLVARVKADALVVPNSAIQQGQQGDYTYVVGPDMKAQLRQVVVGDTIDSVTVVLKGLSPGETVVTDGQLRLTPGAEVKAKNQQEQK